MRPQHDTTVLLLCDRQQSVLHALTPQQRNAVAYTSYGHGARDALGFNGELPERCTGHYLLGNGYRAYNPVLMRFNSPDSWSPFGEGGLNAYAYCLGDPVNRRDPTGHFAWGDGLSMLVGLVGIGLSVTSLGVGTPLGVLASSLGAAAEVMAVASVSSKQGSGGSDLMWVAVGLAAASSVVAVGGLFDRLKDASVTAHNALVPNPLATPALSEAREHINSGLTGLENPTSFTKALSATNASLGSHGDKTLTLGHAKDYMELANKVEGGSISNTTAHLIAASKWADVGGSNGFVGTTFNSLAALWSGSIDANLRKTGASLRRSST